MKKLETSWRFPGNVLNKLPAIYKLFAGGKKAEYS